MALVMYKLPRNSKWWYNPFSENFVGRKYGNMYVISSVGSVERLIDDCFFTRVCNQQLDGRAKYGQPHPFSSISERKRSWRRQWISHEYFLYLLYYIYHVKIIMGHIKYMYPSKSEHTHLCQLSYLKLMVSYWNLSYIYIQN